MPFVDGRKHLEFGRARRGVARALEAVGDLRAVQAQIVAVGPQESGLIGEAGKVFEAPLLDRLDIDLPDTQIARNVHLSPSQSDPRFAQPRADFDRVKALRKLLHVHSAPGVRDGFFSMHAADAAHRAVRLRNLGTRACANAQYSRHRLERQGFPLRPG